MGFVITSKKENDRNNRCRSEVRILALCTERNGGRKVVNEELEQELENNKVDIVFPTNEGYVKVENIERVRDVIIRKSVRVSKLIEELEVKGKTFK